MRYLIPLISSVIYRLGGWGKFGFLFIPIASPKLWRWFIGIPIALITGNWIYVFTYCIATNVFSYGEKHPLTEIFGRFNWFISGFMFGLASLSWGNAVLSGCVMYTLMSLSNEGIRYQGYWWQNADEGKVWYLDHKWVEIGIGLCGTLIYMVR